GVEASATPRRPPRTAPTAKIRNLASPRIGYPAPVSETNASDDGPNAHSQRVSWAELFFDLVFVFAVTQVASAAQSAGSAIAVGRALVLFIPFWWAWVGVSILYNGVELVTTMRHLKVFALGLGAFVMSIAVP